LTSSTGDHIIHSACPWGRRYYEDEIIKELESWHRYRRRNTHQDVETDAGLMMPCMQGIWFNVQIVEKCVYLTEYVLIAGTIKDER
jgi:hypothetical protein